MQKPDNERIERVKGKLDNERAEDDVAKIQAGRKKRAAAQLKHDEGLGQKVGGAKLIPPARVRAEVPSERGPR